MIYAPHQGGLGTRQIPPLGAQLLTVGAPREFAVGRESLNHILL